MKLYDFLFSYMEEFEYKQDIWHSVDLVKLDKQEKTKLWKLFVKTYSKDMYEDMIFGNSMTKFYNEYKNFFILDIDGDKKMDAFIIYKTSGNYKKISLLGSNKKAKRKLITKLLDLLAQPGWFIEASLKVQSVLAKNTSSTVKPITNKKLIKKVLSKFSNKEIENIDDNGFYQRKVSNSGKIINKVMYGNIKDE